MRNVTLASHSLFQAKLLSKASPNHSESDDVSNAEVRPSEINQHRMGTSLPLKDAIKLQKLATQVCNFKWI